MTTNQASLQTDSTDSLKNSHGDRNLFLLGSVCIAIALLSTTISLSLYYSSGDIYLDRSRPDFLPDTTETTTAIKSDSSDYVFSDTGTLSADELDEYLQNLSELIDAIDSLSSPYSPSSLSDDALGIPDAEPDETDNA